MFLQDFLEHTGFRRVIAGPRVLSVWDSFETFREAAGIVEMSKSSSKPLNRLLIGPRTRLVGCETSGLVSGTGFCVAAPLMPDAIEVNHRQQKSHQTPSRRPTWFVVNL